MQLGYNQWRQRPDAVPKPWPAAALQAFTRHAGRYGTRRLRAELHTDGHVVGRYALRSWGHRHGLRALSIRIDQASTLLSFSRPGNPYPNAQAGAS